MRQIKLLEGIAVVALASAFSAVPRQASAQGVIDNWAQVKSPAAPAVQSVTVDDKTALLVMDFNEGTCRDSVAPSCIRAIPKVRALIDKAHAHHMLVIYTSYPNMKPFVKALEPTKGEPMVVAPADKFYHTDLNKMLQARGIKTVIATGTAGNGAVLFTAFGAAVRGYNVIVPVDTMPCRSAYAEQASIWNLKNDPGLGSKVTLTSATMIEF
jgi:nicotinamidase-related amidase